jgi:hypothetical protein
MAELLDDAFQRSGVARRASSYDVAQTNRGTMAREPEPRTAARLVPGPRMAALRNMSPGRPAAQVLARGPRHPPTVLTSSNGRAPLPAPASRPSAARATPHNPPRPSVAQTPRAAAQPVARPRAVELRDMPRGNPARPVTRT